MAVQYWCPECKKLLRAANPVPAGKKIRCPSCQMVFVPVAENAARSGRGEPSYEEVSVQSRTPAPRLRDGEDHDAPRRRPATRAAFDDDENDDFSPRRRDRRRYEDEEDDYDRERRRPRKRKQAAGSLMPLFIGLGAVGLLVVVFVITAFVAPGFLLSKNPAVAKGPGGAPGPGPMPGADGWREVEFKEFGFKVMMPGPPKRNTRHIGGIGKQEEFGVERGNDAFMVIHARIPAAGNERVVLQGAIDGVSRSGRVLSTKFVNVQGFQAAEVHLLPNARRGAPPGLELKDLIIVADNQLYQVMLAGTGDFVRSEDARKFVQSFQILK